MDRLCEWFVYVSVYLLVDIPSLGVVLGECVFACTWVGKCVRGCVWVSLIVFGFACEAV